MEDNIFSFLFENSSDAIFLTTLKGQIKEVNRTASKMLGYEKEEFLAMNFSLLKTPHFRQLENLNLNKIIENKLLTYEVDLLKKNSEICAVEMKSRLVDYKGNEVIITVARNITKRKEFEQEIFNTIIRTEEKERKRFASELHDGLSPILSTISLYADLLKKDDFKKTKKEEIINDIEELSLLAINTAKEIARNLTPSILQDLGLAAAVNEFCVFINKTGNIEISLNTNEYCEKHSDLHDAILYQAVKELINNALKHSKATKIVIELKNKNNQTILYYKDNGIGFDFENTVSANFGLGINNIINKISRIKGYCDFYSVKGEGLVFMATIKQ